MRQLTFIGLLLTFSVCKAQIKVFIRFQDECKGEIVDAEYELSQFDSGKFYQSKGATVVLPSKGLYYLTAIITRGNRRCLFGCPLRIKKEIFRDTLDVPKLLTEAPALHQQRKLYLVCDSVANGKYIEYFKNGTVKLKGEFYDGLPDGYLISYDENGERKSKLKYKNGYLIRSRYY